MTSSHAFLGVCDSYWHQFCTMTFLFVLRVSTGFELTYIIYLKSIGHTIGKRILFGWECHLENINGISQKTKMASFITSWGLPGEAQPLMAFDAIGHH